MRFDSYWDFDTYTLGANPGGTPNGANQGYFDDLSGNDQKAYAAEFSPLDYVPWDGFGGRFGGAFYSANSNNNGAMAVVQHTPKRSTSTKRISRSASGRRRPTASSWGAGGRVAVGTGSL